MKSRPTWFKIVLNEIRSKGLKSTIHKVREKLYVYSQGETVKQLVIDKFTGEKMIFEKYEKPMVSIVIPVYNQIHMTLDCLYTIKKYINDVTYEIIIGDDNSSDETVEIHKYAENIKVVRDGENRGFLLNCNNSAKHAEGKYLIFLNNDTQVKEGWLSSLVSLIENDDSIGMVGSKLVYPDGRLQEAGGIIWNDASGWNFGRLGSPDEPEYNYVKEVDYISGASILLSRELWEEIGGFDERYAPAYYEDSDLAFEVRKRGLKVVYQPKSMVIHFEGISHGTDTGQGMKRYQVLNLEKFREKWTVELKRDHFPNAENVFLARDRSRDKKHILVIDHYVPHFDQDAGSRTMWQYLELFADMGYQVTFTGDNFYPHEPYTSRLQAMGVEVLYGAKYQTEFKQWFDGVKEHLDFVYLLRPHIAVNYIDMIKESGVPVAYNGTDMHYLRLQREYDLSEEKSKGLLKKIEQTKDMELSIYGKSDVLITISEYEKEVLQGLFPDKKVIVKPTYIFKEKFPISSKGYDDRKGILFVGSFRHDPNIDGVVWFINDILPKIGKSHDITLYIAGSGAPESLYQMEDQGVVCKGFVSDEELENLYNDCRVVVAPLRFGAGVKGKIIESIAYGVPIVTTPVGQEGIPDSNETMCTAEDDAQFAEMLRDIYLNKDKWEKMRADQVKYAKEHFSIEHAKNVVEDMFS